MKPSSEIAVSPAVIPITKGRPAPVGVGERWLLALMAIFLLHVILFGAGGIAEALSRRMSQPWRVLPPEPMLHVFGSFLLAQCSLAAIGLGRSRLASHWKALLAIGLATAIWILLHVALLGHAKGDSEVGSWLTALVTQGLVVAFGIQAVELLASPQTNGRSRQYTILGLLMWTTLVAAFLGGMRWLATLLGWTMVVSEWPSFFPLQALAAFSAILAILLCLIVSWSASWRRTAAFSTLALACTTAAFVGFTHFCFKAPGATSQEMCWIMGGQTLFLLAVLIPLRAALQPRAVELAPLEIESHSTENSATTG
jgi:hypothetical protein